MSAAIAGAQDKAPVDKEGHGAAHGCLSYSEDFVDLALLEGDIAAALATAG
ncbi:hypothetical protein [Streptomyces sp. NPDC090135]|uniref:hypothetical protein n=1 Tax=Streptomyces sp. NPDC090135 TaxID=3365957 RepID=UPI0038255E4F